jgi:hypothetical protein
MPRRYERIALCLKVAKKAFLVAKSGAHGGNRQIAKLQQARASPETARIIAVSFARVAMTQAWRFANAAMQIVTDG